MRQSEIQTKTRLAAANPAEPTRHPTGVRRIPASPAPVARHARNHYHVSDEGTPGMDVQGQVTQLLADFGVRSDAPDELLPLVYDELRAIAQRRMSQERVGHTLEATALVHEAYMKLVGSRNLTWESRGHFFAIAAEAMRRILIDHARRRDSQKRGGGNRAVPLTCVDLAAEQDEGQVLAIDEALVALEKEDARSAEVVKLRFYAGLTVAMTAEVLGISERTVMREWSFGRAKLFEYLEASKDE